MNYPGSTRSTETAQECGCMVCVEARKAVRAHEAWASSGMKSDLGSMRNLSMWNLSMWNPAPGIMMATGPVGSIMPDPTPEPIPVEHRGEFGTLSAPVAIKVVAAERPLDAHDHQSHYPSPLRLDLGCGPNKKEGWFGVDSRSFPGVDLVFNLVSITDLDTRIDPRGSWYKPWPFADDSVDEAQASHFVEHLTAGERIHFANELYRVLKPGAKALIVTPHWASCRAYGDLTHQWPPVSEFWFPYLSAAWRASNAPHNDGYTCDFTSTYGYGINPKLGVRSQEFQQWALEFYKESAMDLVATLVKPAKTAP